MGPHSSGQALNLAKGRSWSRGNRGKEGKEVRGGGDRPQAWTGGRWRFGQTKGTPGFSTAESSVQIGNFNKTLRGKKSVSKQKE